MALRFFKKSSDQLFIFPTTTDSVEEKNKYSPVGPLPMKANGAIVVHRPSHRYSTIRSLPVYLQDEPFDDDFIVEDATEETDISDMKATDESSCCSSSGSQPTVDEEIDLVDLVHTENKRLRQQIRIERELHEKWRLGQEKLQQELLFAKNTIKNLERVSLRFQKLLDTPKPYKKGHGRRVSTGVSFDYNNNNNNEHIIMAYERKLKILLDEIDAMEEGEQDLAKAFSIQKNECEKLNRKLSYKDDIIRQLAYDLQLLLQRTD